MPSRTSKTRTIALAAAAWIAFLGVAPAATPSAGPTSNPAAEALYARAKAYWRGRTDVPYLRYGALVRYLHNGHVFDNWWDAYERTSDRAIGLTPLLDPVENNRRIRGVTFSIFGLKVADSNPDAEPIRIDEPRLDPTSSFGLTGRDGVTLPAPSSPGPSAGDSGDLREITRVDAANKTYRIEIAGSDVLDGTPATHLTFVPLRDPDVNRVRDLWVDPQNGRTIEMNVQGILAGKPYDGVEWTIRYVLVDGREYLQQLIADEPLHFGFDTTIPKFEYDFVDYHFPATVPQYTFDRPF